MSRNGEQQQSKKNTHIFSHISLSVLLLLLLLMDSVNPFPNAKLTGADTDDLWDGVKKPRLCIRIGLDFVCKSRRTKKKTISKRHWTPELPAMVGEMSLSGNSGYNNRRCAPVPGFGGEMD